MNSLKIFAEGTGGVSEEVKNKIKQLPGANEGEGYTNSVLQNVINYILYAAGIIAVVMIIIAAIQITSSAGDPSAVAKGKKTLTWSVIGLVVVILAYAIVNFVIGRI